jgi:hypothetical protein
VQASCLHPPFANGDTRCGRSFTRCFDRYDNSIVYFFSFFGCFLLVFGLAAVGIAAYRVAKHRPHATRGLVVAIVATLIGVGATTAAISQA